MKILHVVHAYPPSMGGSQWFVKNLSEQLAAQFGDEVTVFTTTALDTATFAGRGGAVVEPGISEENGVIVRRFPFVRGWYRTRRLFSGIADFLHLPGWDILRAIHQGPVIPGLADAVAASGADVVMAMAFPLWHMFAAQKGAEKGGIPLVFTGAIHPTDTWGFNRPMIFNAIRRADAYFALTPFEKTFLTKRGISAAKIRVVGSGIAPLPDSLPPPPETRRRLDIPTNAPIILALGRQNPRKRFDFLLAAMPQVWDEIPDARVIFAGAADESTASLRQFDDARVLVLNDISEAEKHALLSACDVLVLPSTAESFGIVFVEAWSHGKPVIGANAGAVASLIDDGENGLLFTPNSADSLAKAIVKIWSQPGLAQTMGTIGIQKVHENYTWEVVTHRVRSVYTRISQ